VGRDEQLQDAMNQWLSGSEPNIKPDGACNGATPDVEPGLADADEVLDDATISELRDALTPQLRDGLIQAFDESLPKCLADIVSAVQRDDRVELTRAAHLLKGSAATLGAARLRMACQRLEQTGRDQDQAIEQEQLGQLHAAASEARRALHQQLA
jgi:HPt (histidine-containing phosphotransfer) domain-containing protein